MKIAILTQFLRYNYGGILQNFALQTVLRRMGHEVVTLDPRRYQYSWKQYIGRSMKRVILRILLGKHDKPILWEWHVDNYVRTLGKNTFPFINKYIKRKAYCDLSKDVRPSQYNAFIVGSDQVWRPEYNTNMGNMFLDFTEGWDIKRIAYAASFGVDQWKGNREITTVGRRMLPQFDAVSVRENSGVDICKNVFGVNAQHVLDPTLLLTKEDYISLLHLDKVPKSKGNLLVYILDYTEDKRKLIDRIAEDYHLQPFRVNSDVEDRSADLKDRIQPPVEQWLRGFMDAEYIITDSFHACVFSIIFEKPFVVYGNSSRGLARFYSLLIPLKLQQCVVQSAEDYYKFNSFSNTSKICLEKERKRSVQYLTNSI